MSSAAPAARPAASAAVLVPFLVITFIWGSTWLVIRGQLGIVPPSWSVAYRFLVASASAFLFVGFNRTPLRIGRPAQQLTVLIGFTQFVLNYNFVYRAEEHVTSGLVAVVFALLVVPNAVLGWLLLGRRITKGFLAGSAVALVGVALLFVQEMRASGGHPREIVWGIALTLASVLAASISNVAQAMERGRAVPIMALLAWSMLWGALMNVGWALASDGWPVFDLSASYVAGLLYLGVIASALAFGLYYQVIRAIGPAQAAYSSVLIPILAMGLSTIFEGYRWSLLAAAGAALALAGLVLALRARSPSR